MLYPEYPEYDNFSESGALIKVVGVGGGGGNAVNHMVKNMVKVDVVEALGGESTVSGEDIGRIIFYAVNTDAQALRKSQVQQTVQIGGATTKGLGAGGNPNVGRKSAEDDQEEIKKMLEGADMVFIAAGMGGGTGTGAAPVVAKVARELGILTVAVVTKPFEFEGKKLMTFEEIGVKDLAQYVDSMIIIPNDHMEKVLPKNASLIEAFSVANDVLRNSVMGISDMITSPGLINVDIADVKTVMSQMGQAMIGFGSAKGEPGEGRAEEAVSLAVRNDLLEKVELTNAKGILVNVTSGLDLTREEFSIIGKTINSFASDETAIIVGTSLVPDMEKEIRITVVATGLGEIIPNEPVQIRPVRHPDVVEGGRVNIVSGLRTPELSVAEPPKSKNPHLADIDKPIGDRIKELRIFDPANHETNSSN